MPSQRHDAWRVSGSRCVLDKVAVTKPPRSFAAAILTGLSSTGAVGVALWGATRLVLVLKVTPAEAAYLSVWIALIGIPGRALGAWLSDALGRRWAGFLLSVAAGCGTMLAGYLHDVYIGAASAFFLLLLLASFFSNASFSVVFPYMAELWPAKLQFWVFAAPAAN